jgi:hypothetical protein
MLRFIEQDGKLGKYIGSQNWESDAFFSIQCYVEKQSFEENDPELFEKMKKELDEFLYVVKLLGVDFGNFKLKRVGFCSEKNCFELICATSLPRNFKYFIPLPRKRMKRINERKFKGLGIKATGKEQKEKEILQ